MGVQRTKTGPGNKEPAIIVKSSGAKKLCGFIAALFIIVCASYFVCKHVRFVIAIIRSDNKRVDCIFTSFVVVTEWGH